MLTILIASPQYNTSPQYKTPERFFCIRGLDIPCEKLLPKPRQHNQLCSLINERDSLIYFLQYLYKIPTKILLKTTLPRSINAGC